MASYLSSLMPGSSTANSIQGMCTAAQSVLTNPTPFFAGAVTGITQGWTQLQEGEAPLLNSHIWSNLTDHAAIALVSHLLSHLEAIELSEEDQEMIEEAKRLFAETPIETESMNDEQVTTVQTSNKVELAKSAHRVIYCLKKAHIFVGPVHINTHTPPSSKKLATHRQELERSSIQGTTPISEVVRELARYTDLQAPSTDVAPLTLAAHTTVASSDPLQDEHLLVQQELETTEKIKRLEKGATHMITMQILHRIGNRPLDISTCKNHLQHSTDKEIRNSFLHAYCGNSYMRKIYAILYILILGLTRPIVEHICRQLLDKTRALLRDKERFCSTIEQLIATMSEYYACVEQARKEYLSPARTDNAGLFTTYLAQRITEFGLTQKLPLSQIGESLRITILKHGIPKKSMKRQIPLITAVVDKILYMFRIAIIDMAIKRVDLSKFATRSITLSMDQGQLPLIRFLTESISAFQRNLLNKKLDTHENASPSSDLPYTLQQAVATFAQHILTFTDTVLANNNPNALQTVHNPLKELLLKTAQALQPLFQKDLSALPNLLTDSLYSTFLLSIHTVLGFTPTDHEAQIQKLVEALIPLFYTDSTTHPLTAVEQKKAIEQARDNLLGVQKDTVTQFVIHSLRQHLEEVTTLHQQIKTYMKTEKETLITLVKNMSVSLHQLIKIGEEKNGTEENTSSLTVASHIVDSIVTYLQHIMTQLKQDLVRDCYSDTKSKLYNIYAICNHYISTARPQIETLIQVGKQIEKHTQSIANAKACLEQLAQSPDENNAAAHQSLETILASCQDPKLNNVCQLEDVETLWKQTVEAKQVAQQKETHRKHTTALATINEAYTTLQQALHTHKERQGRFSLITSLFSDETQGEAQQTLLTAYRTAHETITQAATEAGWNELTQQLPDTGTLVKQVHVPLFYSYSPLQATINKIQDRVMREPNPEALDIEVAKKAYQESCKDLETRLKTFITQQEKELIEAKQRVVHSSEDLLRQIENLQTLGPNFQVEGGCLSLYKQDIYQTFYSYTPTITGQVKAATEAYLNSLTPSSAYFQQLMLSVTASCLVE